MNGNNNTTNCGRECNNNNKCCSLKCARRRQRVLENTSKLGPMVRQQAAQLADIPTATHAVPAAAAPATAPPSHLLSTPRELLCV